MKHYFLIIILLLASHMVKASDVEEFRGGHPLIITRVWNDLSTHEEANRMQDCVEALENETKREATENEVKNCINKNL